MKNSLIEIKYQNEIIEKEGGKPPVYIQLANIIRNKIASGEYPPGSRLPSEYSIGKAYGISTMTVRQALSIVSEQGLLRRVQGSGTYVLNPMWSKASFNLDALMDKISDDKNIHLKIIKANIIPTPEEILSILYLQDNSRVINLTRTIYYKKLPFMLNQSFLRFDPQSSIFESELEVNSISGIFTGEGSQFIKKATLTIEPYLFSLGEADILSVAANLAGFKIKYLFYDHNDLPFGYGWFLVSSQNMALSTKIGLWE